MFKTPRKLGRLVSHNDTRSDRVGLMTTFVSKNVLEKGSDVPVTMIEKKVVKAEDYAAGLDMPATRDYKLETMLAAGIVPQEVPTTGLLDSADPLDRSNDGLGTAILDRLDAALPHPEPAPAVSEPAPSPQSTE